MTADIIDLDAHRPKPNPGNGAREALITIAEQLPTTLEREGDAAIWADWIIMELWMLGFKVVPLEASDEEEVQA